MVIEIQSSQRFLKRIGNHRGGVEIQRRVIIVLGTRKISPIHARTEESEGNQPPFGDVDGTCKGIQDYSRKAC
jgi:aconitase B